MGNLKYIAKYGTLVLFLLLACKPEKKNTIPSPAPIEVIKIQKSCLNALSEPPFPTDEILLEKCSEEFEFCVRLESATVLLTWIRRITLWVAEVETRCRTI